MTNRTVLQASLGTAILALVMRVHSQFVRGDDPQGLDK